MCGDFVFDATLYAVKIVEFLQTTVWTYKARCGALYMCVCNSSAKIGWHLTDISQKYKRVMFLTETQCLCVCVYWMCLCDCSDDDMQSLASLMSLQQKEVGDDSADDVNMSDVANMADVADDDIVDTCPPVLTDIRQIVSRSPHKHINCCLLKILEMIQP